MENNWFWCKINGKAREGGGEKNDFGEEKKN